MDVVGNKVDDYLALGSDAIAFNSCVEDCIADGLPLLMSGKTYIINSPIKIPTSRGVSMIGAGWMTTLKAAPKLNGFIIEFDSTEGPVVGFRLKSLTVDGNAGQQSAGGGVWARGAVQSFFDEIHFYNCYDVGLRLDGIQSGGFGHHNRVRDCLFDGGSVSLGEGIGLRVYASDENMIRDCDFEDLGGVGEEVGAIIDQAGLNSYIGCVIVNGKDGLRIKDTGEVTVIGCKFDGPSRHALIISGYLCIIKGNTFLEGKADYSYIWMNNDGSNIVTENTFKTPYSAVMRSLVRESGNTSDNLVSLNMVRYNSPVAVTAFERNSPKTGIWRNNSAKKKVK